MIFDDFSHESKLVVLYMIWKLDYALEWWGIYVLASLSQSLFSLSYVLTGLCVLSTISSVRPWLGNDE